MKLGTTSYAFRYLLQDPGRAPSLAAIVERTRSYGLSRLQICENARPLELSDKEWSAFLQQAFDNELEIQLGCKTLDMECLERHLERAAGTPSRMLRIVLEEDPASPPGRSELAAFLDEATPKLEKSGVRLAIENYFAIPSGLLADVVAPYPPSIGFCLDSANSLRKFEPPAYVLKCLGSRAFCFHLKDFKVTGDNVGFSVRGAPLGTGDFDLEEFLQGIFSLQDTPEIFLENWVPATGCWEADVEADARWLQESLAHLRGRLAHRGV
jgi:3-oxoisoapionate decarboxylase